MGAFLILSLALLTTTGYANPWIFEEIKPLTEADTVKKSNIPDIPVKDIDPTTPTIHIKQDIRNDILGKNTSSTKFKEGVKKLLDFLEAGPKAVGDAPDKEATSASNSQNAEGNEMQDAAKDSNKNDNRILKQNNELLSYKQDKELNQVKDLNTVATGDHLGSIDKDSHDVNGKNQKDPNSNFVDQQKEPPAIPMRSEINGNGDVSNHPTESLLQDSMVDKDLHSTATGEHMSSFDKDRQDDKPIKESNSNFVTQQKEPPAIPMRSNIDSNGMRRPIHATASLIHDGMGAKTGWGGSLVAKSRIPYASMPYKATQLLQNNAIVRSNYKIATPVNVPKYNPYSALYQRSSFPHYYGNYGVAHPNTMATQAYKYPYNQRRMLPLKPNRFKPALRSNIRLPFYRNAALKTPAYNPQLRLPYTKTFVPRHPAAIPQRAPMSSFLARRSQIPAFHNFQIPQLHNVYPAIPKWNLLRRNTIFKPALRPTGVKYRRMAINDRGRSYDGLSTTRDKVTQKTPLPLPLASIMTAARIVVPARPHTLNGAFKSNVETLPSADPEEKGARAI